MPKGTALWLKENTKLTDRQIADFCCLRLEDIDFLDNRSGHPCDPIKLEQLTKEMIEKCEKNPDLNLKLTGDIPVQPKKGTYLDKHQKNNLINCVAWMQQNTKCTSKEISRLFKRTEKYINTLISKIETEGNIEPRHPVSLFLCTFDEIRDLAELHKKQ
jgi:hypothetical protein